MGESGDNGRRYVLDPSLLARVARMQASKALDVGCGEGRFSRLLTERGIQVTGIDPTDSLLNRARELDPDGIYLSVVAEQLPFPDEAFDLVVSCLTLVDIPDYRSAISEMARVLAPGGHLLIANLTELQSAGMAVGWQYDTAGLPQHFGIDNYSSEWSTWVEWAGIRVRNWHRPLSMYMQAFLHQGLVLTFFDEPKPIDGYEDVHQLNERVPWFNVLEWRKQIPPV